MNREFLTSTGPTFGGASQRADSSHYPWYKHGEHVNHTCIIAGPTFTIARTWVIRSAAPNKIGLRKERNHSTCPSRHRELQTTSSRPLCKGRDRHP